MIESRIKTKDSREKRDQPTNESSGTTNGKVLELGDGGKIGRSGAQVLVGVGGVGDGGEDQDHLTKQEILESTTVRES